MLGYENFSPSKLSIRLRLVLEELPLQTSRNYP